MRLTGVLFLVLFVLVLAVIHDSAYGRSLVGRHLDKIQACVASPFEGGCSVGMIPSCSPSSLTTRMGVIRMLLLMRTESRSPGWIVSTCQCH